MPFLAFGIVPEADSHWHPTVCRQLDPKLSLSLVQRRLLAGHKQRLAMIAKNSHSGLASPLSSSSPWLSLRIAIDASADRVSAAIN